MTTLATLPLPTSDGTGTLRRPRLGHISFLNCYPFYWSMTRTGTLTEVDMVRDTPEVLSTALVGGSLDIGPIALAEYLRHSEDLLLLPEIAIGCDGPVLSCNLVSKRPLAELDGCRVALGSTSRTTVLLAQILLEERFGVRPEYFPARPELDVMLAQGEAAVLIGDAALRAYLRKGPGMLHTADVHDTGQMWKEWTGLPMVFAVWAVRRAFAERQPDLTAAVHQELLRARDHALSELASVSHQAARWEPFSGEELERYYRTLTYDLTPHHIRGIKEYARRAADRGSVPASPAYAFFSG